MLVGRFGLQEGEPVDEKLQSPLFDNLPKVQAATESSALA